MKASRPQDNRGMVSAATLVDPFAATRSLGETDPCCRKDAATVPKQLGDVIGKAARRTGSQPACSPSSQRKQET